MALTAAHDQPVEYPDSDGKPLADNEAQLEAIFMLAGGLRHLYRDNADVHVASDLLWYPVEGQPKICAAPDVMVIEGLGKALLRSYRPWEHGGGATLVIEVLSHKGSTFELLDKLVFYDRHGAAEYLVIDPEEAQLRAWEREPGGHLLPVATDDGWTSPATGVRFAYEDAALVATAPDGRRFALPEEEIARAEHEAARADSEAARAAALEAEVQALRQRLAES